MSFSLHVARDYLFGGSDVVLALTSPASTLEKRDIMRIEKRVDQCSYGRYCPDGWHCVSATECQKNRNYAWTAVFGVLLLLLIILCCIRRRRAARAVPAQPVVTTTIPLQSYAPPAGDPNMAYQTPAYPPPAGAPYGAPPPNYPPPASSPYTDKPLDAPGTYSNYPPASGAYSPAPYHTDPAYGGTPSYSAAPPTSYPPPAQPASAYSGPYNPPVGQPQGHTGAAYPVPQGEAASYAPPK
ncbi:hypothetical protein EDD11_005604 [Mortierella claussenii]|nr:hypothetical protein EDD11_005604 [Mortierella claussenii]